MVMHAAAPSNLSKSAQVFLLMKRQSYDCDQKLFGAEANPSSGC